jgi:hypothetical protein
MRSRVGVGIPERWEVVGSRTMRTGVLLTCGEALDGTDPILRQASANKTPIRVAITLHREIGMLPAREKQRLRVRLIAKPVSSESDTF